MLPANNLDDDGDRLCTVSGSHGMVRQRGTALGFPLLVLAFALFLVRVLLT